MGVLAWVLSGALFVAIAAGLMALLFTLLGAGWARLAGASLAVAVGVSVVIRIATSFAEAVEALAAVAHRDGGEHGPETPLSASFHDPLAGQQRIFTASTYRY